MELYDGRTAKYWRDLWTVLCEMSYLNNSTEETFIINPNDRLFFMRNAKRYPDEITLDSVWRDFSRKYKEPHIVPTLKKMYVPRELVDSLGIHTWLTYSFPNCEITYW